MTLPAWPISTTRPLAGGFGMQFMLDPIVTEMEGGNVRQRARPGDDVATITQTLRLKAADFDTLIAWIRGTLNNGTARFIMDVWLGTATANKVCQLYKPGSNLRYAWQGPDAIDVTMTLRVYGVS